MKRIYEKAKTMDVFKYSFGGLGSNLAYLLIMGYLAFFYTDIFGISSMAVAGLMLVTRLIDAITDPIMGMIGDNTRSKMGKFRPWIIFGSPVLGLLIFLLFTAPELSPTMKIVYVYVVYIIYSLASTVVNIPYHALTPVMSKDPQQRTVIVAGKQGMGIMSQLFTTILAVPLVNILGGGKQGWAIYGAFIGIMVTVSFLVCAWGGKPYDKSSTNAPKEKIDVKKNLNLVFHNKPMVMLMIAFGTDVVANATHSASMMYYFKYVLEREDLVATVATGMLVCGVLAIPLLPILTKIFGKKNLYWYGSLISIFPLAIMWIWPTAPVMVLMINMSFFGFIAKLPGGLGWAMLPECGDYAEWKYGIRGDGILSAALTFINKLGMAVGGAAASLLLGMVGFAANQDQTPAVINTIVFLRYGMPILGYIVSLISMHFYEITSEKYDQIRKELDERQG